jgi:hypothetical protein
MHAVRLRYGVAGSSVAAGGWTPPVQAPHACGTSRVAGLRCPSGQGTGRRGAQGQGGQDMCSAAPGCQAPQRAACAVGQPARGAGSCFCASGSRGGRQPAAVAATAAAAPPPAPHRTRAPQPAHPHSRTCSIRCCTPCMPSAPARPRCRQGKQRLACIMGLCPAAGRRARAPCRRA